MATSAIRLDQENVPARVIKGGHSHSRARFGPSKSFQTNNARLATPRRALGDLGNLNFDSKSNGFGKPFGNTPRLQKLHGSASARNSHKKRSALKAVPREEKVEPHFPDKENMFPFIETEEKPSQSRYVDTILQNVDKLYNGCFRRYPESTSDEILNPKLDLGFELETRPISDVDISFPTFKGTSQSFTGESDTAVISGIEFELPPLDF